MEKITLGKRLATQIEIEFDREAIIRAEKESMEKEKILNQSFNNTTMISANQTNNQTLVIENHDDDDDLFGVGDARLEKQLSFAPDQGSLFKLDPVQEPV